MSGPLRILSVAEKPSVARELAKLISSDGSVGRTRDGHSVYNKCFDIDSCSFQGRNASMIMTSVTGHMMGNEFDENTKIWNGVDPVVLFDAEIKREVKKESLGIEKTLKAEAVKCNVLMLWLDCDMEGENIAYEVMEVCKAANPRLDIYRARFSGN